MTCFHFVFIPILWNPISPSCFLYCMHHGVGQHETRYWIEEGKKRDTKRRLTSVDKSQAVIVVAPLRIPLLCQPVSSSLSQLSQLCRILPPHILCFCIRHAWLVFMKYFFLFLKNTTFIFKGHYQYMSMIIMKPLPSMHDVEESIYNSSICKKGSKNMA